MAQNIALITGVTGQDGSYLAEFLLAKGYEVHGIVRRNSEFARRRIDGLRFHRSFHLHYGDMVDSHSLHVILSKVRPTEVYHLAAQSHVGVSFMTPDYSAQVNALGTLRLLGVIREVGLDARFYQASTSELFGGQPETLPQNERTPFRPRSPYATAKLFAYWTTIGYRQAYGMHASNGILFNHESPRRGRNFVTKKISQGVARIARGEPEILSLGNLEAQRDWGYAPEFVEAMWLMMQRPEPGDYVVGTGSSYSVRQFVEFCFAEVGITVEWNGHGVDETARDSRSGKILVVVDPVYFRPTEVDQLRADPAAAQKALPWRAKTLAPELARLMVRYDLVHEDYGFPDLVSDGEVAARLSSR